MEQDALLGWRGFRDGEAASVSALLPRPSAKAVRPVQPYAARPAHAPLAGLAGTDLSRRFSSWRGSSGRRYVFSVFPLGRGGSADGCPRFGAAVALAVARGPDGTRRIVDATQTDWDASFCFEAGRLADAVAAGADEIHMHLLTSDRAARLAIVQDLRPNPFDMP